jgi:hypothetical protein
MIILQFYGFIGHNYLLWNSDSVAFLVTLVTVPIGFLCRNLQLSLNISRSVCSQISVKTVVDPSGK